LFNAGIINHKRGDHWAKRQRRQAKKRREKKKKERGYDEPGA
jgi:hypothetical protein